MKRLILLVFLPSVFFSLRLAIAVTRLALAFLIGTQLQPANFFGAKSQAIMDRNKPLLLAVLKEFVLVWISLSAGMFIVFLFILGNNFYAWMQRTP